AAGAEDGEEKAVCIGLPHKVHTVPVVSVRPRVALYFVNIFPQGNKSFCCVTPHNRLFFIQ
ncbi:ABC transporter permease, partial [Enterobacter hormaechei]|uniref:ABC transporter permease n=1 Tax=Enterobacter hormaechei TaxID=158836 RepID=UPI002044D708